MFIPSPEIIHLLSTFSPVFTQPSFRKLVKLTCGVILAPGRRTVASALRAVGHQDDQCFGKYHRFLSRDRWSALHASKLLLLLILTIFNGPAQSIDLVVDETLERRFGKMIAYKGWFRDAVRSTGNTTITSPGIRWLCLCVLVTVPWNKRRWALPFSIIPVCSEKTCEKRKRMFRGGIGLTIDMLIKVRQWIGKETKIRLLGDGGFTSIELAQFWNQLQIEQIGRLRIDAVLHDFAPEQPENKRGPKPKKGKRQPSLKQRSIDPATTWASMTVAWYAGKQQDVEIATGTSLWYVAGNDPAPMRWVLVRLKDPTAADRDKVCAFFSSNLDAVPEQIVALYAERWNIEILFEEIRAFLGFETQRGWCNRTIGRTTPLLFGAFSIIVILAKQLYPNELPVKQTAWYAKEGATFSDALSAVRQHLWQYNIEVESLINNSRSVNQHDFCLIPKHVFRALQEIACYTA
jgi:hypothetical protein